MNLITNYFNFHCKLPFSPSLANDVPLKLAFNGLASLISDLKSAVKVKFLVALCIKVDCNNFEE